VCYDYNIEQADGTLDWQCPEANLIYADGMSHNERGETGTVSATEPYDQGIVFLSQSRPEPYFNYNYIENVDTASESNVWQSTSYADAGSETTCGCKVCPNVTCNLALTGPRAGALEADTQVDNLAYKPSLEACVGGSGNCLSMNGDACCVGTFSYAYSTAACESTCNNYWSAISVERPLSDLWETVQEPLPK
jgi:hypothetical protein